MNTLKKIMYIYIFLLDYLVLYIGFGSIKFRSPAEFEDHLLWLASDRSTHCLCKYCSIPRRSVQSKTQEFSQTSQKNSHLATPSSSTTTTDQVVVLHPQ